MHAAATDGETVVSEDGVCILPNAMHELFAGMVLYQFYTMVKLKVKSCLCQGTCNRVVPMNHSFKRI